MAQKKSRQTFEKLKREQAVKERRVRKQERKQAARIAKAEGLTGAEGSETGEPLDDLGIEAEDVPDPALTPSPNGQ